MSFYPTVIALRLFDYAATEKSKLWKYSSDMFGKHLVLEGEHFVLLC